MRPQRYFNNRQVSQREESLKLRPKINIDKIHYVRDARYSATAHDTCRITLSFYLLYLDRRGLFRVTLIKTKRFLEDHLFRNKLMLHSYANMSCGKV